MENSSQVELPKTESRAATTWVWGKPWSRWRTARLLLLLLWLLVVLAWGFTKLPEVFLLFKIISAIVFLVLLWPWIRGPYLLYTRGWRSPHATFEVRAVGPEEVGFSDNVASSLKKLGFEFAGILTKDVGSDRPTVEITIYVHPLNRDSAQVGRVTTRSRTVDVLVFKTRFDDGFAFETSNSGIPAILLANPQCPIFRFPQIRQRADLYRIHQKIKEQFATDRHPVIGSKSEELSEFVVQAEKIHQRNAARDYKLNAAGDRCVYKVRGAIRHAWLHTWPVDFIRKMRVEYRAVKKAAELGLRINPKLGGLADPNRTGRTMQL